MKRGWLIAIAIVLAVALGGLVVKAKFFSKESPGALMVSSVPKGVVFVDGNQVDVTPFSDTNIPAGEHVVKIVPESSEGDLLPWEGKIVVLPNILTVIKRDLASDEASAAGETLSLEKTDERGTSALAVVSDPDKAVVKVNGEPKGFAPVLVENLTPGEYQVTISSTGYKERNVVANTVAGYKLTINVKLAQEVEGIEEEEAEEEGEEVEEEEEAEEEAEATPTPTPEEEVEEGPTPVPPDKPYVKIKDTPTGWLRVRAEASTSSEELAMVDPGQMFPYLGEEKSGWYKIEYEEDEEGWVSSVYVELVE